MWRRPVRPERHPHLCQCGSPLLAQYDLAALAGAWRPDALAGRPTTLWRYREVLPIEDGLDPVTLGEGFTPLLRARRLEAAFGIRRIHIKDESLNPTNSFKARGLSVAVTRARDLGARTLAVPSAGNAANALAAYAAAAGLEAQVFMPKDVKAPFIRECELYGAEVTLVEGLITDAGRAAAEQGSSQGWYDTSTLKEPYRVEGKKTMAYELGEQLAWQWPTWIIYPTGGGTGIIGMWKAFAELETLGWVSGQTRPPMVSVQAEGCAPIVRAFNAGRARAEPWTEARTVADGLRVPSAVGDFLILRALRESDGAAVAVTDDDMIDAMRELGRLKRFSKSSSTREAVHGTPTCNVHAGGSMRAYSMDLRERVLRESDAGMKAAAGAVKYHVSASWVRRLKQRRRETGEVAPRQQRYGRHPVLAPQLHTLAALIQEQPDRTLAELQVALATSASLATIWRAVQQLGFTLKKNGPRLRTRSPRPSTRPASSFLMRAGGAPISSGGMGAALAASGSPITPPRAGGRAAPSSPPCG